MHLFVFIIIHCYYHYYYYKHFSQIKGIEQCFLALFQFCLFIFSLSDWRNDDVLYSVMHTHMLLRQEISRCIRDINTCSDSTITYLRSSSWLSKFNTENNM